jgi:hypothetical protein
MINIVTACSRPENLPKLFSSIRFEHIHMWHIVYDTSKNNTIQFQFQGNPKISERTCDVKGICGHPQINYALDRIQEGYVYVLDDDNIMHPDFWNIVSKFDGEHVFTFDQFRSPQGRKLLGNQIKESKIDTSQFIVPRKLIGSTRWVEQKHNGDFFFINEIHNNHPTKFKYISGVYAYWNFLAKPKSKFPLRFRKRLS